MTVCDTTMKPAIHVCLMQPPGYIHAMALLEAAEYVAEKARLAGYPSKLFKNRLAQHGLNIVFGAHINPRQSYPPNTVIFNTEQIPEQSAWINSQYKNCLDRHYVWDYSSFNLELIGHDRTERIDFYHVDRLQRLCPEPRREYDLIFYGSMNERRKRIIDDLRGRGLNILTVFGLYGDERDALLIKARAVLNLHFYESQIFQQIRTFYALSNGMPVISENYPEASAPSLYKEVLFTPGNRPFGDYVQDLLLRNGALEREAQAKIDRFQFTRDNTDFDQALERALAAVLGKSPAHTQPLSPTRLNLCGKEYRQDYLNIDTGPDSQPDAVLDLSAPLQLPVSMPSPTWGTITLAENQLDEIIAADVLARVQQLPQLMSNCLKLLKEGGRITIVVPHELGVGAWQDPAHVRAFNESSWLPYTQWFWQLGWLHERFECTETSLNLTNYGQSLVDKNVSQEDVLRTPRAIDSMKVVLTKRKTTPDERTVARSYGNGLIAF